MKTKAEIEAEDKAFYSQMCKEAGIPESLAREYKLTIEELIKLAK